MYSLCFSLTGEETLQRLICVIIVVHCFVVHFVSRLKRNTHTHTHTRRPTYMETNTYYLVCTHEHKR